MFVIKQDGCPLDLRCTLMESGQSFIWNEIEDAGAFAAVLCDRPVYLTQLPGGIGVDGDVSETEIRRYLSLNESYDVSSCEDKRLREAVRLCPGLRVLRQDIWDALVQFLISQNNNIARIRRLCHALMESYGSRLDHPCGALYGLPDPEKLARLDEEALRRLGMGYRAGYLLHTAQRVCDGFPLWDIPHMPLADARALLCTLPGVGEKVADCVLLFSGGHDDAFPVDVWVERLLRQWYGFTGRNRSQLASEARRRFGPKAGIRQQYLFHAARTGLMPLSEERGGLEQ